MPRLAKKRARKVCVPPGALVHASENKIAKTRIILVNYDEMHLEEREIKALDESIPFVNQPTVTWVNVEGLHQAGVLEKLGECFGLHPLAVEDILNFGERPKMEDFGGYILIVLKIPYHYNNKSNEIETGQISLVLGPNFVISLQERAGEPGGHTCRRCACSCMRCIPYHSMW